MSVAAHAEGGVVSGGRDRLFAALLFLVVFALYLLSMPKSVVLEDDGAFILAAWFNGVAHPPGYPLFTLIGHLFTQLPWGSVAARVHAVSALFGALTCALLYLLALRLVASRVAAMAAAAGLAGSALFWSQSIIAEVYTLNTAFTLLLVLLALDYREGGGRRTLALLALTYGLSLANHWPLIGLATPGLLLLVAPRWREIVRALWWVLPLSLIGLLPYLWMYWNSQSSEFTFFGALESWEELRAYLAREAYAKVDNHPTAEWGDKLTYAGYSLALIPAQFSWPAAAVGALGLVAQFRYIPPAVVGALLVVVLGNTVALALLLGFEDEPLYRVVFRVYPLVAFTVAALWIGCGVRRLSEWLEGRVGRHVGWRGGVGAAVAAVVVVSTFAVNAAPNYRHGDHWSERYARALLESLPADAVLFLSADTDSGPVGVLNRVEGVRSDVTLYHVEGNLFDNRLFKPSVTSGTIRDRLLNHFVRDATRPVYFVEAPDLPWGRESYWLYSRLTPASTQVRIDHLDGSPLYDYFETILRAPEPYDPWSAMHRRLLVADMVPVLAGRVMLGSRDPERDAANLTLATRRFEGKVELLRWLVARNEARWWPLFEREAAAAEALLDQAFTRRKRSELALYRARYHHLRGDPEAAKRHYMISMERWPALANEAYPEYRVLIEGAGQVAGERVGEEERHDAL